MTLKHLTYPSVLNMYRVYQMLGTTKSFAFFVH